MGEVYANRMIGVSENDDRALRQAASTFEHAWFERHPRTPHEAMLTTRELRPLLECLRGNPFLKNPERLWDEEVVRQSWAILLERWPRDENGNYRAR